MVVKRIVKMHTHHIILTDAWSSNWNNNIIFLGNRLHTSYDGDHSYQASGTDMTDAWANYYTHDWWASLPVWENHTYTAY